MMFMITADMAGGNATIGDGKWDVAKTTPKEEFCIPTCKEKIEQCCSQLGNISNLDRIEILNK